MRQLEAFVRDIREHHLVRPDMARDSRRHSANRAGPGDEDILGGEGILEGGVDGVAKRVEEGAKIRINDVRLHPHVARRDDDVVRKRSVTIHAH